MRSPGCTTPLSSALKWCAPSNYTGKVWLSAPTLTLCVLAGWAWCPAADSLAGVPPTQPSSIRTCTCALSLRLRGQAYGEISKGFAAFMQCKKIVDTPFPFPYAQMVLIFLIVTRTIIAEARAALVC